MFGVVAVVLGRGDDRSVRSVVFGIDRSVRNVGSESGGEWWSCMEKEETTLKWEGGQVGRARCGTGFESRVSMTWMYRDLIGQEVNIKAWQL